MNYFLLIKSHSEAPDFEDECEAKTKKEALDTFFARLEKYGYSKKIIEPNIIGENEWNK